MKLQNTPCPWLVILHLILCAAPLVAAQADSQGLIAAAPQGSEITVINVEIDYMIAADHTHTLHPDEIAALEAMFACHGITLNIELSDAIEEVVIIGTGRSDFFNDDSPNAFAEYKALYYDHESEPGWHYALLCHTFRWINGTSNAGLAEILGDDLVLGLGNGIGGVGSAFDRAGAFAHELGHNLGLRHAGSQPESIVTQFKPNLPSVMTYRYGTRGIRHRMHCDGLVADTCSPFRELDYSNGTLPALDEAALREVDGLGLGPVDWNRNGRIDTGTVAYDLANWPASNLGSYNVILDYDEWANIRDVTFGLRSGAALLQTAEIVGCFDEREDGQFFGAASPCVGATDPPAVPEVCVYPYSDSDGDGIGDGCDVCPADSLNDIDNDGICSSVDNCAHSANPEQTDSDGDGIGDACDLCPGAQDSLDADRDGVPDGCDLCEGFPDGVDTDGDGDP
ncbi:MAG TPA: thrombospondin type 3 repeat-containing protein, partial [candidate division Zixibacteria bacterium]|nr:thrombospondin type 3 repeat-containing protein [candidate division Zixibacteria bacterium]